MKKVTLLGAIAGAVFVGNAIAANITLYHLPSCPHCHHAREFISQTLVYEYPDLTVTTVDLSNVENRDEFFAVLKKCEYESGGVPVMVIGEKCIQGYSKSMDDSIRAAVESDMDDASKAKAAENKKAMESDADAFRAANADRANAIAERGTQKGDDADSKKKVTRSNSNWFYYTILAIVILGLVIWLGKRKKK